MKIEDIYPANAEDNQKREHFEQAPLAEKEEIIDSEMDRAKLENQKNFRELASEPDVDPEDKKLYERATAISERVKKEGGLAVVIGGFTRDTILKSLGYHLEPKDIDIEVYGISMTRLQDILAEFGEVNAVGATFGTLKLENFDITIPRTDSKTGKGHKGFKSDFPVDIQLRDAAKRRDLTINALALDPLTGEIIDTVGGLDDIVNKKIRATDPETFIEDPLRVLRVMQFAARFDFDVEENTKEICVELVKKGTLNELPVERFEEEWKKLLLKSKKPSKGLEVARDLEIVSHYPELKALIGCNQEYDWHPEGDVWTHTLMVLDEAKKITKRENLDDNESIILLLSALCHDYGKPATTKIQEVKGVQRITSYEHEEKGVEPAKTFLKSINIPKEIIDQILPLVREHLFPTKYSSEVTRAGLKRLVKKLAPATLKMLVLLGEADVHGRGYWKDQPNAIPDAKEWQGYPSGEALINDVSKIADISVNNAKVQEYVTGKDLIKLGMKEGVVLGNMYRELKIAQEEDKVTGPGDLRLAKLLVFLEKSKEQNVEGEKLLTGEVFSVEEMRTEVRDRIFEIGTHDMGTLVMHLLLKGEPLPEILERNRAAILTAHKHGPAWFKYFDREFYDTAWKSFYGAFEVDLDEQKRLATLDFEEQLEIGLRLITNPEEKLIKKYRESVEIKPQISSGKFAYYVTDQYPFESGMMEGFEVMTQFIPEKRRLCISVMNEDPEKVKEIDQKIREHLPEFRNAKKVGYLFASDENGDDNVFSEADGERVYNELLNILK